jgi:hypothetical protein
MESNPCAKCKAKSIPTFNISPKADAKDPRLLVVTDYAHAAKSGVSISEDRILQEALKNTKFPYVFITPVVKCHIGKVPTKPLIECCEEYLREEIRILKPNVIICIGKAAASVFNISGRIDQLKMGAYQFGDAKVIVTYPFDKVEEAYKYRLEFFKAFAKANRFIDSADEVETNYEMFENALEFSNWVDKAIDGEVTLAADIETTGLDYFAEDARVRTIAFSPRAGRAVVVNYDPSYHAPLKRLLESKKNKFIFHNATFDVSYLRVVLDIWVSELAGDTMLMAYLLSPGLGKWGYGLLNGAFVW